MKKLIVFMFSIVFLESCVTISRYTGEIYPANVTFERPNFKYIKTVTGTSDATFSSSGWDVKKINGIVNEAKQNLYQQLKLKENQAPTNFTLDFVRVGEPTGKYLVLRQLKAVLTADIFEFSENGVYSKSENSDDKSSSQKNSIIQQNNGNYLTEIDDYLKFENQKLNKGDEIMVDFKGTKYRGKLTKSDVNSVTLNYIQKLSQGKWVNMYSDNSKTYTFIKSTIIGLAP
jgi:hypothetical protein